MKQFESDQELIRSYLLSDVEDDQRRQVEERIFTDPEYADYVLMIEAELYEDFVFDVLAGDERRKVSQRLLLTPDRRERVRGTEMLRDYAVQRAARTRSVMDRIVSFLQGNYLVAGVSLATIALVAGLAGWWVLTRNSLQQEVSLLNSSGPDGGVNQFPDASDYAVDIASLRMRSDSEVSLAKEQRVLIPRDLRIVQLRLGAVADEYSYYEVTLSRESDVSLFTLDHLKPRTTADGKLIIVRVPARVFIPGYYQLTLRGIKDDRFENLGVYAFRVVNEN